MSDVQNRAQATVEDDVPDGEDIWEDEEETSLVAQLRNCQPLHTGDTADKENVQNDPGGDNEDNMQIEGIDHASSIEPVATIASILDSCKANLSSLRYLVPRMRSLPDSQQILPVQSGINYIISS